jgi:hypothetical protein
MRLGRVLQMTVWSLSAFGSISRMHVPRIFSPEESLEKNSAQDIALVSFRYFP